MPLKSRGSSLSRLALVCALACLGTGCGGTKRVDPTKAVFADFARRVDEYAALHKQVADSVGVLDETKTQAEIAARADLLAKGIIAARAQAKPGDIFTTEAATIFATLIREEYRRRPPPVRESREDAQEELPDFEPQVNQVYPTNYPLATFPATLLPLLPRLPEDVEYRIVTRNLILRDIEANVIVDVMPRAIP
jgi:hypothetical protein